jgi:hypothetical protein
LNLIILKNLSLKGKAFPVSYVFDPSSEADGMTILLDKESFALFETRGFFLWPVPGLLLQKIEALIKTLPKQFKASFLFRWKRLFSIVYDKLQPNKGKFAFELAKILSEYGRCKNTCFIIR